MSQVNFLQRIITKLNAAGIAYMITGSLGSGLYGELRTTNDIDIVMDPSPVQLKKFVESFEDGQYYVDMESALDAFQRRSMFNVIDFETGWKVDLILIKDRPYSIEEFTRRRPGELLGIPVYVASPEDIILSKLEWVKMSESERQFKDAFGVAVSKWDDLDKNYLQKWAVTLGVEKLFEKLKSEKERTQ